MTTPALPGCPDCRGLGFDIIHSDTHGFQLQTCDSCCQHFDVHDDDAAAVARALLDVIGEAITDAATDRARGFDPDQGAAHVLHDTLRQMWSDRIAAPEPVMPTIATNPPDTVRLGGRCDPHLPPCPQRGSHLTDRELGTVLAALRYWQEHATTVEIGDDSHFHDQTPLDSDEIHALCERLNGG